MDEQARMTELRKAVAGDADALQRLLVHYHKTLQGLVTAHFPDRLRRYSDPDDIMQLTYIAAYGSIRGCTFDGPGGFYKWLEAIALEKLQTVHRDLHRHKRDVRRERHADTSSPDLFTRLAGGDSTPSKHFSRQETSAAILSSIARLTDDQRSVIRMRFLEDRPVEEIAAALGKSEEAVYMLCHRGLKAMQTLLGSISQYLSK